MSGSTRPGLAPESYGPTITIGEILVEIMATTVGDGFLEPLALTGPYPSGAPAIFIDQVAKMGGSAGIIASVGDDDFGRLNTRRLNFDGVDVSAVSVSKDRPTGSAFVRYRPDGSRDFVFNIGQSAAGQVTLTSEAERLIARAGHVHVMGSAFAIPGVGDIIQLAIRSVKARGGSVSFDPNFRKELVDGENGRRLMDQMLSVTDLLLPSDEELHLAAAREQEDAAIDALLGLGISEIVLKRGRRGSSYFAAGGESRHAPAFFVTEIDPTGAGDCFGATYLTARRMGSSPADALQLANAAGARNVTKQGPMEGTSTRADLAEFIRTTETVKA